MRISIIISTVDCLSKTRQFIESLEGTLSKYDCEIIILDNASTDGTSEYLASLPSFYQIIYHQERKSFAINNNFGATLATGEILLLLNNDLILTPGWLQPMLNLYIHEKNVGAIGNIQLNPQTRLIDHAGIAFDLKGVPFHIRKNRKRLPKNSYRECNAITAACMMINRNVFQDLGGFDEGYVNGSEDVDLCIRLRLEGYRILVSHITPIWHHGNSSPGRLDAVARNEDRFASIWKSTTSGWGQREWPSEYLCRYARHFWKMTPNRTSKALFLLAKNRFFP